MTREELLEKRRDGFERWFRGKYNNNHYCRLQWEAWNAALYSVEIELPSLLQIDDQWDSCKVGFNQCIEECRELIHQQGYKVKP